MRFLLIDIGSNSVKCNIYERGEALCLLLSQSRTLGLIRYVENRVLREEGIAALLDTVRDYRSLAQALGCEKAFCVATASLRGLTNGQEITDRITALGCSMRIISGEEEAMLGFRAACDCADLSGKGILIDMGGASTELTAFEGGQVKHFISLPVGCLALFRAHVSSVFPEKNERKAIRDEVRSLLAPLSWLGEYGQHLFLIGGTAKLIGKLIAAQTGTEYRNGMRFLSDDLEACYRAYRSPGKKKIGALLDAAPDRLHTALPGLTAYRTIAKEAGTRDLTLTFAGVREGMALAVLQGEESAHD